jgi:hypothetical protein
MGALAIAGLLGAAMAGDAILRVNQPEQDNSTSSDVTDVAPHWQDQAHPDREIVADCLATVDKSFVMTVSNVMMDVVPPGGRPACRVVRAAVPGMSVYFPGVTG